MRNFIYGTFGLFAAAALGIVSALAANLPVNEFYNAAAIQSTAIGNAFHLQGTTVPGDGGQGYFKPTGSTSCSDDNGATFLKDLRGYCFSRQSNDGGTAALAGTNVFTNPIPFKFDISAQDPNARLWNFCARTFNGINSPASARADTVFTWGYNECGGTRIDTSEAAFAVREENYFIPQNGDNLPQFEYHIALIDTSGVEHRAVSISAKHDGSSMGTAFQGNRISFCVSSSICNLLMTNTVSQTVLDAQAGILFTIRLLNNTCGMSWANAAGSAQLCGAQFNNSDQYVLPNNSVFNGPPTMNQGVNISAAGFASLGSCTGAKVGFIRWISDGNASAYNAVETGGGAQLIQVGCDGAAWRDK